MNKLAYQTWYTETSDYRPSQLSNTITEPSQESSTVLVHNRSTPLGIEEKILALRHIGLLDPSWPSVYPRQDTCRGQQLQSIPHADLAAMLGNLLQRWLSDVEALNLRTQPDNGLNFFGGVRLSGDDKESSEEVGRNAVRRSNVVGATDNSVATVGGEDNDGGNGGFKGPVQVSEAFNVKHVDLKKLWLSDKLQNNG